MKIIKTNPSFKRLTLSSLKPIDKSLFINDVRQLENASKNLDVILKSTKRDFPYRQTRLSMSAIKITARPQKLSFFEKLFGRRTVVSFFPTGQLHDLVSGEKAFEEFFKKTISKVK